MAIKKQTAYKKYTRQKLSEVEGDLKLGKGAVIIAKDKTIVVNGRIKNKGGFKCKGNLEVRSIRSDKGSVRIFGDLTVIKEVSVDKSLIVKGKVKAEEIRAGMCIKVANGTTAESVKAGIKTVLNGNNDIESVSSGTKVILHGSHKIGSISTGTKAKLYGLLDVEKVSSGTRIFADQGKIGSASAGLSIFGLNNIEFERASAGFSIKLNSGNVKNASAGFSIKAKKRLSFTSLSAGFNVKLKQGGTGETAKAGFSVKSGSDLEFTEAVKAGFSCIVKGNLTTKDIKTGRNIIARFIEADTIRVAKRGKLFGIVKARSVTLGEKARARNLYVEDLEMYEKSRARNVFANNITVEDYAVLSGIVEYTDSFDTEAKAKIRVKPKKVESLPLPKA